MKKLIILLSLLLMCGCSSGDIEENKVVETNTPAPTLSVEPTVSVDVTKLPLASIGIFNDTEDPSLYCIVEIEAYQNDDEFTSINFDPFYDFINQHRNDGTLERFSYYDYNNPDDTILTTMGFTPQSTYDYKISYYYRFFKVDDIKANNFNGSFLGHSTKIGNVLISSKFKKFTKQSIKVSSCFLNGLA